MLKLDTLCAHDLQQNLESNDDVRVDHCACLAALILGKASRVNDAHLLDDGRLSRLTSTCKGKLLVNAPDLFSTPISREKGILCILHQSDANCTYPEEVS